MDEKKVGSVERVRLALEAKGANSEIERFDQSTRTAADAAAAIGCSVGQIAKSLIFRAKKSERSVLVIARGDGRVNEKKIAAALGEKIGNGLVGLGTKQTLVFNLRDYRRGVPWHDFSVGSGGGVSPAG